MTRAGEVPPLERQMSVLGIVESNQPASKAEVEEAMSMAEGVSSSYTGRILQTLVMRGFVHVRKVGRRCYNEYTLTPSGSGALSRMREDESW